MKDRFQPLVVTFGLSEQTLEALAQNASVLTLQNSPSGIVVVNPNSCNVLSFVSHAVHAIFYDEASLENNDLEFIERWRSEHRIDAPLAAYNEPTAKLVLTLARKVSIQARLSAQYLNELATLRQIHEELHNSYDELRTYLSAERVGIPRTVFYNEPNTEISIPDQALTFVQPLPIDYRRLTGVSLYNKGTPPEFADGDFKVTLFSPDDDEIVHEWSEDIRTIPQGWVTFAFERRKGIYLRKNVALRVTLRRTYGDDSGPKFALGGSRVRSEKAVVVDGVTALHALAMKCWAAPSGASLVISGQMWPTIRLDGQPVTQIELNLSNRLDVVDVLRTADQVGHPTVLWDHNRQWILVHPIGRSPTIAKLPGVCPAGTRRIVAEVETVHEQAGAAEYMMMIEQPDDVSAFSEAVEEGDWVRVPAMTSTEIYVDLDAPLSKCCSLLLMTRMASEYPADFCWSHFKRISFEGAF